MKIRYTPEQKAQVFESMEKYHAGAMSREEVLAAHPGRSFDQLYQLHWRAHRKTSRKQKSQGVVDTTATESIPPALRGVWNRIVFSGVQKNVAHFAVFGGNGKLTDKQVSRIEKLANSSGEASFKLKLGNGKFTLESVA